jgi:hypothetical protein
LKPINNQDGTTDPAISAAGAAVVGILNGSVLDIDKYR